jgi:hypothetical protein
MFRIFFNGTNLGIFLLHDKYPRSSFQKEEGIVPIKIQLALRVAGYDPQSGSRFEAEPHPALSMLTPTLRGYQR